MERVEELGGLCYLQQASFELGRNKRTESRFRGIISILHCSKQRKMQIIPLNFHSVLLFLHNSKLAYCVKRTHLLESGINYNRFKLPWIISSGLPRRFHHGFNIWWFNLSTENDTYNTCNLGVWMNTSNFNQRRKRGKGCPGGQSLAKLQIKASKSVYCFWREGKTRGKTSRSREENQLTQSTYDI